MNILSVLPKKITTTFWGQLLLNPNRRKGVNFVHILKDKSILCKSRVKKEIIALSIIMIASIVIRFIISDFPKTIFVYGDEMRYFGIARSIGNAWGLSFRNATTDYQKLLYSIFLTPAFLLKNETARISLINLLNCIAMSSTAIPVWLIAKELKIASIWRIISAIITLVWPDMIYSMTFMSEVIYWPIFMWYIYIWIKNNKKRSYKLTVLASAVCYLGYFCKEIFLAAFLAYIIIELLFPFIDSLVKHHTIKKVEYDIKNIKYLAVYIVIFLGIHFILKMSFFSGLPNSYNQMSFSVILSGYNFLYLIYGAIYYLAGIILAVFIFPFLLPIIEYKKLDRFEKKFFLHIVSFILIAIAVVAYTITVREDLGRVAPRMHMRYFGPALMVTMIFLINVLNKETTWNGKKNVALTIAGMATFLGYICLIFKGSVSGSPDQYSLYWYTGIQNKLGAWSIADSNGLIIYPYALLIGIMLIIIMTVFLLLYFRNKKRAFIISFITLVVMASLICNIGGGKTVFLTYSADENLTDDIISLNAFLVDNPGNVLYITSDDVATSEIKYIDTYYEEVDSLYMTRQKKILEIDGSILSSDISINEPIYAGAYKKVDHFDYIMVEKGVEMGAKEFKNVEVIENTPGFTLYRNLDPRIINVDLSSDYSFGGTNLFINCFGDDYNVPHFEIEGLGGKEESFSWTEGKKLEVSVPIQEESEKTVEIKINLNNTFNGEQRYFITQNAKVIASGSVTGESTISFQAELNETDDYLKFTVEMPDAKVISEVYEDSEDSREVALAISSIEIHKINH